MFMIIPDNKKFHFLLDPYNLTRLDYVVPTTVTTVSGTVTASRSCCSDTVNSTMPIKPTLLIHRLIKRFHYTLDVKSLSPTIHLYGWKANYVC